VERRKLDFVDAAKLLLWGHVRGEEADVSPHDGTSILFGCSLYTNLTGKNGVLALFSVAFFRGVEAT